MQQTESFTPPKAQNKAPQEIDTPEGTKKCPYCAELIPINSTFCSICETSLTENLSNEIPLIEYTNTSKFVSKEETPKNIKQWNWGAFWLSWIWGIGNKSFKTFYALIPYFGFIWMFVCGAKGNEWSWQNKQWSSIEDYNNTQRKWAIAGNGLAILLIILVSILFVFAQNFSNESIKQDQTSVQEEINYNSNMDKQDDFIEMSEEEYLRIIKEQEQEKQTAKPMQQTVQPKQQLVAQPQKQIQQATTKINVVVPQSKPIQTQQQNQEIDDFMN